MMLSGFITHEEAVIYEQVNCSYNKFWVPLVWANAVLTQCRRDGKIESDMGFRLIMEVRYTKYSTSSYNLCFKILQLKNG